MKLFKKILVGVDFSSVDRLVGGDLSPSNAEAVRRAKWLAKLNEAELEFFTTLNLGHQTRRLIDEHQSAAATVEDQAQQACAKLVEEAKADGVDATSSTSFGTPWLQLIRKVLKGKHDLIIVGARHHNALHQLLIGSTGMKLLRKCPCAVWVTHTAPDEEGGPILVAHDLTDVGDEALRIGAEMAELENVPLVVVHSSERVMVDVPEAMIIADQAGGDAIEKTKAMLTEKVAAFNLSQPTTVEVLEGTPSVVLLDATKRHEIDLLVMGTVARSGIPGLLFGNTAENVMPQVDCAVLAIKPKGFVTPVAL